MRYLVYLLFPVIFLSCSSADENYQLKNVTVITGDDVVRQVRQSDYTAIYFWATWCAPCRSTLKRDIKPLLDSPQRDDMQVLVVAISKDPEQVQDIITKAGITQTTYVVNDYRFPNALSEKIKMNSIISDINDDVDFQNKVPVVLVTDKSGKVYGDTYSIYDLSRFLRGEL